MTREQTLEAALRQLIRAAQSVVETTREVEFPTDDGLGVFPLVVKDRYLDAIKAELPAARAALAPEETPPVDEPTCPECHHPWAEHFRKHEPGSARPESSGCQHKRCRCFYVAPAPDETPRQCVDCNHASGSLGMPLRCSFTNLPASTSLHFCSDWEPIRHPSRPPAPEERGEEDK